MTNREKFKEVYGFELDGNPCAAPQSICNEQTCERCPFWGWWDKEYKSCFKYEESKKAMTRTEAELAIVEKIKEIKDIALKYDKDIESLSMAVRHYDGTEDYFDNEWVINIHSDLDSAIQHCEEVADEKEEDAILYHNCATYKQNLYEKGLAENTEKECRACAEEHRQLAEWLKELKAYKETWNKLGMWLADTRLAIAPDEFLNDVDEELVRVAQVDMIDTVLEWMDKQEVEE